MRVMAVKTDRESIPLMHDLRSNGAIRDNIKADRKRYLSNRRKEWWQKNRVNVHCLISIFYIIALGLMVINIFNR